MRKPERELSQKQREELLSLQKDRFERIMNRHKGLLLKEGEGRLEMTPAKLRSLNGMERTGGEPGRASSLLARWIKRT